VGLGCWVGRAAGRWAAAISSPAARWLGHHRSGCSPERISTIHLVSQPRRLHERLACGTSGWPRS
jgi:hypothetical protein